MRVGRVAATVLLLLAAGRVMAACEFGRSGSEPSLQSVFDDLLGAGAPSATADCISADKTWHASAELDASIVIELAGFAAKNEFGIYDASDPSERIRLFKGRDGAGDSSNVQFESNGDGFDVVVNGKSRGEIGRDFGFYLLTAAHQLYFSDPALNNRSEDHLVAYQGNGATFARGPLAGSSFAAGMYLLGFEDLPLRHSDRDYQDFVALIDMATPVPLPAGIVLLGSSLLMATVLRRRRPLAS